MWVILFCISSSSCATALAYYGIVSATDIAGSIALGISGINALAAIITGIAAYQSIKEREREDARRFSDNRSNTRSSSVRDSDFPMDPG